MSSSDMFDIFIQYADVCSMHRKSLEMKDSTSLSIHLLTRSVSPCLTMSLLDRHIDTPWLHILQSSWTSRPDHRISQGWSRPLLTSSGWGCVIFVVFVVVLGQWRTAAPSNHRNLSSLAMSRYVSLWPTFAARLLHVCWSLEICPVCPVCPCHPLPSPAYVLSTFLYDILPTARWDASDRQEQKSHETWHQDQVLESGESQVCSSQTASKCFKISVESCFNTGNIWQSLWIATRESLKSNFRIWAQRISEHIVYIYST